MRIRVAELSRHAGETVRVAGWVERVRELGGVAFVVLREATGHVQLVVPPELARPWGPEWVVQVTGRCIVEPRARGGLEIQVVHAEVLAEALAPPLELHRPTLTANLETQLLYRQVALRHPSQQAIFRLQAELVRGFASFLECEGFVGVRTPKIVATGTEGGSELFAVDYFGHPAYLAQSPQFYKQTLVGVFERVYEIAPVYRAEPHATARHLAEYVSLDVEMGFLAGLEELMAFEERLLGHMLTQAGLPAPPPIPRIALAEAQAIVGEARENDLSPEGERRLCRWACDTHGSEWVFVTHYPRSKRPFYALPSVGTETLTESFDLLYRGLEVTTGGLRIHRYPELVASIESRGLNPESFAHYLLPFRHGMPPHGGFALGLERLTAQVLGLSNVREACLFPRDKNRLTP